MEYIVGPVVAILISIKFADARVRVRAKTASEEHDALREHIELVEKRVNIIDTEVPKKLIITLAPIAKAVTELQEQIGVK